MRNTFNNPHHVIRCSVCYECKVGIFHVCRDCLGFFGICHSCYEKQTEGKLGDVCPANHTYFEVGGKSWKALRRDTVNSEGLTFKDWVVSLRKEYGVSDLEDPRSLLDARSLQVKAPTSKEPKGEIFAPEAADAGEGTGSEQAR
jgi:hypothetical protein